MKLQEAILGADALRPNAYTYDQKLQWINELEGRVKGEILDFHEDFEDVTLEAYTTDDAQTALLAPEPYSEIYTYWLFMKIDFMNGETARFNNSALMFNTAWLAYANCVNRAHAPKQNVSLSGARGE